MSDSTILHPAIRQYRHNNGNGFVMGYDAEETDKVVSGLQQEIQLLRSDLQAAEILRDTYKAAEEKATLRGDEWKRRAILMWAMEDTPLLLLDYPEAAEWFEGEK